MSKLESFWKKVFRILWVGSEPGYYENFSLERYTKGKWRQRSVDPSLLKLVVCGSSVAPRLQGLCEDQEAEMSRWASSICIAALIGWSFLLSVFALE